MKTISSFIIGVLAGIAVSLIAILVFPRVRLSKSLCQSSTDEQLFSVKIVNLSLAPLTGVSIDFSLCYRLRDNSIREVRIGSLAQNAIAFVGKYTKKNEDYALLLDFHLLGNQLEDFKNEKAYIKLRFTATHSFSHTSVFKKQSYSYSDVIPGLFEHGKSTNIVAFR